MIIIIAYLINVAILHSQNLYSTITDKPQKQIYIPKRCCKLLLLLLLASVH